MKAPLSSPVPWVALLALALAGPPLMAQGPAPGRPGMEATNLPPHLARWLQRLARRDTNEYGRLMALWHTNPRAFRRELRIRVDKARLRRALRPYPALRRAYEKLPPDRQDALVEELFCPPFPHPRSGGGRLRLADARIRRLVAAYRSSADPEEKERLRRRIRQRLAEKFDETIGRHARRLERLRSQLEEVEAELRFRTAHRDDIIDHQLDLLLGE